MSSLVAANSSTLENSALNPMARLVKLYRGAFMTGQSPSVEFFAGTLIFCLLTFLLGYFWFMHSKKGFADVL